MAAPALGKPEQDAETCPPRLGTHKCAETLLRPVLHPFILCLGRKPSDLPTSHPGGGQDKKAELVVVATPRVLQRHEVTVSHSPLDSLPRPPVPPDWPCCVPVASARLIGAQQTRRWVLVGTDHPYLCPQPLQTAPPSASLGASSCLRRPFPLQCPSSPFLCPSLPGTHSLGHHGRGHRQRLDPSEAAGAGAALGPALCQQEAEQPQQEPRALQWQPGGYLLQSAHLRPQEAQVAAPRSVWVAVGRCTSDGMAGRRFPAWIELLWVPLALTFPLVSVLPSPNL